MRRTIALMTAAGLLALAPAGAWAQGAAPMKHSEQMMLESAKTPADHKALADEYREKAGAARALAKEHRSMGKSYLTGKVSYGKIKEAQDMKKHCDRIAELNEDLAKQYDELAKGEEAAAM